ncbi:putative MFS family arabinose efflux permease [Arthrobacter sp. V4I6]|uniref:MFS transporter n=1 Tax=unclassified Arthrobacter TaxID=235627 RepID=UPI0027870487|nr:MULTISPECIES: MFS transporter [unclassified Arthrobacter]MDQ0822068.1 putative MFS family arabinose efflux permease [Arthrobacter sp. V1I7]MDQ0856336.1 putative MFS family arabinose efflux permease [Arthrobacter sp. V4I6]
MQGEAPGTQSEVQPELDRRQSTRLPLVIYVLAVGTFLMLTTEFVVAGILPQIAGDFQVSVAQAGLLITVFAVGMVVGAPLMSMLTLRLPRRLTLIIALVVFAIGHVIVALGSNFEVLLLARFLTALATGAFWAVAAVVATQSADPAMGARAMGLVNAGGMLATVIGVPLGAFTGQLIGWRGTFWALAALALIVIAPIARHVPHEAQHYRGVSVRSEVSALRSGRLWLALAACATTTGGVLAAYSYISPLLTDQAGIPAGLVPLALTGFGIGSLAGSILGGRFGDAHPHLTTMVAPAASTVILLLIWLLSGQPVLTAALVVLLGLFGLAANPVLVSLAVRFAGQAPTLGSSLSVSAFNIGTAVGSWLAGLALVTPLGATGPAMVGTVIAALAFIPAAALAVAAHRATPTVRDPGARSAATTAADAGPRTNVHVGN